MVDVEIWLAKSKWWVGRNGVTQAAVVHYLIAKIFGLVLFGRLWCGWAYWMVMILDQTSPLTFSQLKRIIRPV